MDKLRSLHYFAAAAERGSFSAAARQFGVSVAAVAKLITALERNLGMKLFERHAHGLALTASGNAYLEACRPALEMLNDADEQAAAGSSRARGTVVVGVQPIIMQECLTAALPRFNALYPDIQLDLRYFMRLVDEQTRGVDVFLALGWPSADGLVHRHIGASSFFVAAAPSYWAARGKPEHPRELEHHNCLCIRSNQGSLMDLWHFRKGDEQVSIRARGWFISDNVHRDAVRDLAIAGAGVVRLLDWHKRKGREIASGALVPCLTDWDMLEVPPINVLYPPSVRRVPRVRLFIDFVTQVFRDIEQQREVHAPATAIPRWMTARKPRASTLLDR